MQMEWPRGLGVLLLLRPRPQQCRRLLSRGARLGRGGTVDTRRPAWGGKPITRISERPLCLNNTTAARPGMATQLHQLPQQPWPPDIRSKGTQQVIHNKGTKGTPNILLLGEGEFA